MDWNWKSKKGSVGFTSWNWLFILPLIFESGIRQLELTVKIDSWKLYLSFIFDCCDLTVGIDSCIYTIRYDCWQVDFDSLFYRVNSWQLLRQLHDDRDDERKPKRRRWNLEKKKTWSFYLKETFSFSLKSNLAFKYNLVYSQKYFEKKSEWENDFMF